MICEKVFLNERENIFFVKYLLDNSKEIEEKRRHPAMIVCPGGGYLGLSEREAEPIAMHFLARGYQAFVLNYSVGDSGEAVYPKPLYDIAKMIMTIREHSQEWNVDSDKIGIIGFSAGAHLCANLSVHWKDEFLKTYFDLSDSEIIKPNVAILAYPVTDYIYQDQLGNEREEFKESDPVLGGLSRYDYMKNVNQALLGTDHSEERMREVSPINYVSKDVPPTFIWHTAKDQLVFVGNSLKYAMELEKYHIPFELHVFENGQHGLALADYTTSGTTEMIDKNVACWAELADSFLERHL